MHNIGNPVAPTEWQAIKAAVETLGISAELFDIRREPDIAAAFQNMPQRIVRWDRRTDPVQCRDHR
jgi:hypothetical protein